MIDFLEWFMPWALEVLYVAIAIVYIAAGKYGPITYWVGAAILNLGVIIMASTSR